MCRPVLHLGQDRHTKPDLAHRLQRLSKEAFVVPSGEESKKRGMYPPGVRFPSFEILPATTFIIRAVVAVGL